MEPTSTRHNNNYQWMEPTSTRHNSNYQWMEPTSTRHNNNYRHYHHSHCCQQRHRFNVHFSMLPWVKQFPPIKMTQLGNMEQNFITEFPSSNQSPNLRWPSRRNSAAHSGMGRSLSLSPSGWYLSLRWGVSHTGSPSPLWSVFRVTVRKFECLETFVHNVNPYIYVVAWHDKSQNYIIAITSHNRLITSTQCMDVTSHPRMCCWIFPWRRT